VRNPDIVVSDEVSLRAALEAASPNQTIAVDGMIEVHGPEEAMVTTSGVTLTCATPGSGLRLFGFGAGIRLLVYQANGVTIERLVLENTEGEGYTLAVQSSEDVRISDNRMTCGVICILLFASPRATVTRNDCVSDIFLSVSGIYVMSDSARVTANTFVTTIESPMGALQHLGGIVVSGHSGVLVSNNRVSGPWYNGISVRFTEGTKVERNKVDGAMVNGIRAVSDVEPLSSNTFRSNRLNTEGTGIFVDAACDNLFVGNGIGRGAVNGVVFGESTGANVYLGNRQIVADNGAFDCDGDGEVDPNIIGRVRGRR
jgi:parallel beta-helix repeat protein